MKVNTCYLVAVAVCALGGCQSSQEVVTPAAQETPARFSFEDTAALLKERNILLARLDDKPSFVPREEFERGLRRRMRKHPSWKVLSVHLAEVDMPNPHFEIYDQPTYVVEVTGPSTGNCFDFYLATTGRYEGGSCFYPHRS